ncbi:MAG: hypothetical protein JSV08_01895 [Acidobacteriota bacterium]|nr:MAG: hypothetical protein JSV08_01895 [Acidobacteriota bacterium]
MRKRILWLTLFGVTMGYFEAAVVVYLRALYYPDGFQFPLVLISGTVALVELGREFVSLLMLLSVAWIAGRSAWERFAHFCFLFGVWDIFYYVFLKATLDWPPSLGTWDVLFLLPTVWTGPVWAPIVVSLSLIGGALFMDWLVEKRYAFSFPKWLWAVEIAAGLLVILSFTKDAPEVIRGGVPENFAAGLFWAGEGLGIFGFLYGARTIVRRHRARFAESWR